MTQELSHPQVTPEQVQLWEADPVTIAYLKCITWKHADVVDDAGNGSHVDYSNADLTLGMTAQNLGQQQALVTAGDYLSLFSEFNMVMEGDHAED